MPRRAVRSLIVVALLAAAGCGNHDDAAPDGGTPDGAAAGPPPLTVQVAQGALQGKPADGGGRAFLGIPYAAPPVGALRFRAPQPAAAWSGVRDATKRGPMCPQFQLMVGGGKPTIATGTDEDCLSLNVWTPAAATAARPVMVFLHGGAFVLGSGGDAVYDGANLANAGDVVVVTLNYRLGPLGFAALAALDGEDPASPTSGNYGLVDQRAALQWVHDNIATFGGDPSDVTLFGESAGGASVCLHLVSPGSQGLLHRALMESGPCTAFSYPVRDAWEAQGQQLATALGCSGADPTSVRACLRAASVENLLTALPLRTEIVFGPGVSWQPWVDGTVVPDQPAALFAAGHQADVPLLLGANEDEGSLFFKVLGAHVADDADLRLQLVTLYPAAPSSTLDAVMARYSSATFGTAQDAAIRLVGDVLVCDARRVARMHAAAGRPTFLYHFTRAFKWIVPGLGAFHSAELPFVFDNAYQFIPLANAELPLSMAMQGYWSRFAAAGDPNAHDASATTVAWPAYAAASDTDLQLDLTIATQTGLRKDACDFWDGLVGTR
jgi:para-nitrobenzyl esterase